MYILSCRCIEISQNSSKIIDPQPSSHRPVLPREVLVVGSRRYDSPEMVVRAALPPWRGQPVVGLNRQPGGLLRQQNGGSHGQQSRAVRDVSKLSTF